MEQNTGTQNSLVAVQNIEAEEEEFNMVEFFFYLMHNWKSLLMAFLIGATLMAAVHTFMIEPSYKATTELYISNTDSIVSLQDLQIGSALAEDYQAIITSRSVLNQVIEDLQLDTNYRGLRKLISVSNPSGTHIISTSVTTTDLELSRDIANDLLNASVNRIYDIVGIGEPSIIDYSEAEAVENVTPGLMRYVAIGGILGVIVVILFSFIRMMLDSTMKTDDDVEKYLRLPVLTAIPYYKD